MAGQPVKISTKKVAGRPVSTPIKIKAVKFIVTVNMPNSFGRPKEYQTVSMDNVETKHLSLFLAKNCIDVFNDKTQKMICHVSYHNIAYWVPLENDPDRS